MDCVGERRGRCAVGKIPRRHTGGKILHNIIAVCVFAHNPYSKKTPDVSGCFWSERLHDGVGGSAFRGDMKAIYKFFHAATSEQSLRYISDGN